MENLKTPKKYCKECWDTFCPALSSWDCEKCYELNKGGNKNEI